MNTTADAPRPIQIMAIAYLPNVPDLVGAIGAHQTLNTAALLTPATTSARPPTAIIAEAQAPPTGSPAKKAGTATRPNKIQGTESVQVSRTSAARSSVAASFRSRFGA